MGSGEPGEPLQNQGDSDETEKRPRQASLLGALLLEYELLKTTLDRHATVGYAILPIVLTAFGGYLILGNYNSSKLAGVGILLILFLATIGLGISHAVVNQLGLRLVEIELRIADILEVAREKGVYHHQSAVAQAPFGFNLYFALLLVVDIAVLAGATWQWWGTMVEWNWPLFLRLIAATTPIALNAAAGSGLLLVEIHTKKEKSRLLSKKPSPTESERPAAWTQGEGKPIDNSE